MLLPLFDKLVKQENVNARIFYLQERIFGKFYRAGPAIAGAGGTGLGLFIAQGLVDVLGGRITVTSSEGSGSSFVVELPAAGAFARAVE